jgi:hypothetical protein
VVGGEVNTLSNIGSHQIVNLSFGAKRKKKKHPETFKRSFYSQQEGKEAGKIEYSESNKSKDLLIVGDRVII